MEVVKMDLKKCNLSENDHSIMIFYSRDVNAFSVCIIDLSVVYTNIDM